VHRAHPGGGPHRHRPRPRGPRDAARRGRGRHPARGHEPRHHRDRARHGAARPRRRQPPAPRPRPRPRARRARGPRQRAPAGGGAGDPGRRAGAHGPARRGGAARDHRRRRRGPASRPPRRRAARRGHRHVVELRGPLPRGDRRLPRPLPGRDRRRARARGRPDRRGRAHARRPRGGRRAVRPLRPAHPDGAARPRPAERASALPRPARAARLTRTLQRDSVTSTDATPETTLPALDQTERVILRAAEEEGGLGCPCDLLVVRDTTGALTAAALDLLAEHPDARVYSWNTSRAETDALAAAFAGPLAEGRLVLATDTEPRALEEFAAGSEAHLVLARLPK